MVVSPPSLCPLKTLIAPQKSWADNRSSENTPPSIFIGGHTSKIRLSLIICLFYLTCRSKCVNLLFQYSIDNLHHNCLPDWATLLDTLFWKTSIFWKTSLSRTHKSAGCCFNISLVGNTIGKIDGIKWWYNIYIYIYIVNPKLVYWRFITNYKNKILGLSPLC